MEQKMNIELKKIGVQQAIFSLIVMWKELQDLLNSSENKSADDKYENIVGEKFKEIDLIDGPSHDFSEILENEGKRFRETVKTTEALCREKSKEIEEKIREVEFSKKFIAERAKELEVREKKIDGKFTELEVENKKFSEERNIVKAKLVEKWVEVQKRDLELNKREEEINSREKNVNHSASSYRKKREELEGKMREINTQKSSMDEYANYLESKRKELDEGFKELNSKKREFAVHRSSIAAKCAELKEHKLKLKARKEKLNFREEEVKKNQIQCEKKSKETEDKMREINSARERVEEYGKELEMKQNELDNGFKELESKKMEFTEMTDRSAGVNISNAETSKGPTKRKRTSSDQRPTHRAPRRTELHAPQVSHTVSNQNSDSRETFWTFCTSCHFQFQYAKAVLNKESTCRHCSTKFTAYELDAASLPQVDYSAENLKYYPMTERNAGNSRAGGSGSV